MNNSTSKTIFYTVLFFVLVVLGIGGYFAYNIFVKQEGEVVDVVKVDDNFNKIFSKTDKTAKTDKTDKTDNDFVTYESLGCEAGGKKFKHGSFKKFYSLNIIKVSESCDNFVQVKKCFDGR
jgi:anionic cell wall polymer biosynthesis LytR-Cps2A-Psr (LCP) family protein